MKIGLTYDLKKTYLDIGYKEEDVAEFDDETTINAIEDTLIFLGYTEIERIGNVRDLIKLLNRGNRWDLVFNIAEGFRGYGRESQIPAILDDFEIPYTFSDPLVLALTLHKGMMKRVARDLGVMTPNFIIIKNLKDMDFFSDIYSNIFLPSLHYPLFAKPISEGTGKGISFYSKINNKDEFDSVCRELLIKYNQPVLVEKYLSGRELTVGIIGTGEDAEIIGVMEVLYTKKSEPNAYSYYNKKYSDTIMEYELVNYHNDLAAAKAITMSLDLWREINGRDACRIDFRTDEFGNPYFLEINPLPGLNPLFSDLPLLCMKAGMTYFELIKRIMISATKRTRQS